MTRAKRGRPRLVDQRRSGTTPEEEILDAAAELFAANGFARTSTRMIAEAVGVRQASLYHHFATKVDILDSLLVSTVDRPLRLARWLPTSKRPADVQLYAMAWFDVHQLLTGKWNLGALLQSPEAQDPKFARFFGKRAALQLCYIELARAAVVGDIDTDLVSHLPFHFVEAAIHLRVDQPEWLAGQHPESVATTLSESVLRAVGHATGLPAIATQAQLVLAEFDSR